MTAQWHWIRLYGLVTAVLWVAGAAPAHGANVETVLMPGPVIEGHAGIETDCKQCHMRFDKSAQVALCNACHTEVADDISRKRGRHGRLEERECRVCHTDHRGRHAIIAPLDVKKFDHRLTDFELKDGHARPEVTCGHCHQPGAKFREAPDACMACHKKDDTHQGALGVQCASCHTERDWQQVRFDHGTTVFPLAGKHAEIACKGCHSDPRFKGAPSACVACHKKDDTHKTRFGVKCETCHVDGDWKTLRFDHARDTGYPLRGKHAQTACAGCHKGFLYQEETPTACVACHQSDDRHKGRFGSKCETCHVEKDWRTVIFDHGRQTRYPLLGKHLTVQCVACHKGLMYKDKTDSRCYACHQKDDTHKGQQGRSCAECHNERAWNVTRFDHDLTKFPLLAKHKLAKCKDCHHAYTYKDAQVACIACHLKDDQHKRRLGPDCGQCHNARGWAYWDFDHDKRTQFPLGGRHKGLDCVACHNRPAHHSAALPTACGSCHGWDDAHNGRFGQACGRCHDTSSFKKVRMGSGRAGARQ